jgi:hypothetical protein
MSALLTASIMTALAINTGVIFYGILRYGVTVCKEPRRWLAWAEFVLMIAVVGFGVWTLCLLSI